MDPAKRIRRKLLDWYRRVRRPLPWRATSDPYRIWVSEVMLQQTRVVAVVPYYERFINRFPDVKSLAEAPEQELLACWSGLGYYSRARNLQRSAQIVVEMGGFPENFKRIRSLPGIGDYTAAAIASIAFGLPHAALDGNVLRVLSRLSNDAGDIRARETRERISALASRLLDRKNPGDFNQAMMELGATVCTPKRPQCLLCPLSPECDALAAGRHNELPVKLRRVQMVQSEYTLLLVRRNGCFLLRQRHTNSGKLAGFWEAPCMADLPAARVGREIGRFKHSIMHHEYRVTVRFASVVKCPPGFRWIGAGTLEQLPLTTATKKALKLL